MSYVLVPGAGGNASYWYRVEAELRQRGRDVVAVDLPADDDSAGLQEYADAVVWAVGDRTDLVLVAQSMAGFTAPLVCERLPVTLVVLLNAMIPNPGETPGEWWDNTGQAQARREKDVRDGRPVDVPFDVETYFLHDVPQAVLDEAISQPKRQSDGIFGSRWTGQAWPDVPTRALAGSDDRFFPVEFQRRVAHDRLGLSLEEIPGGHCVALSHPTELADRLECYRAEVETAIRASVQRASSRQVPGAV